MSLGLKDEVSKSLNKIQKEFEGTDDKAKKVESAIKEITKALNANEDPKITAAVRSLIRLLKEGGVEAKGLSNALSKVEGARVFGEISKEAEKTCKAVNKMLETLLGGKGSVEMSMHEISKKAADYSKELAELDARLKKVAHDGKSDGMRGDQTKDVREQIRNAQTFLDLIQRIDLKQKEIAQKKAEQPNVNTKELERANTLLEKFGTTLMDIMRKGNVGGSAMLGNMPMALRATMREVKQTMDQFAKENPLSVFANGKAKADAALSDVETRLHRLRGLLEEGTSKGYDTSMLKERIADLKILKEQLDRLMLDENKGRLTNKPYMTSLLSDVAVGLKQARNAQSVYGQEKAKSIALEREQTREEERRAANLRRMAILSDSLGKSLSKGEREGMRGLGLNLNTQALDKALGEASELKKKIEEANVALMGKGGRASYEWYAAQASRLKESLDKATQSQKELNAAQEKANRKAERDTKREEAKAAREAAAAEKQRQREIEVSTSRIESLGRAIDKMREARLGSVGRGVDTSHIDTEIEHAERLRNLLISINSLLRGESWRDNLGQVGGLGNGRRVAGFNQAARAQSEANAQTDRLNKEKERSVELERKHQQEVAKTAAKVRNDLARAFEQAKEKASGMSGVMQDLKSLFMQGGIVYGAQQFLMSVIQTGGQLEQQHIALQSILGDIQNANTLFGQVKELALNSPFTFSELNKDVKQLAAYGVEYEDLYDTTKRLADMASGLGVSFERIALAFGQVQARGWLDGKELRQISYAGIPLLNKLSEYYSKKEGRKVTTSEVKTRISGRGVDFEDVKNIFWEMTDAGGQFYNMQQVLSETLLGRFNKLKDAWEIMLSEFASGNSIVGKGLKGIIDMVTWLVQSLHTLAPVVATAFAGPMLHRLGNVLDGGMSKAILSAKGGMANDYTRKSLEGKKLNKVEREILATKNQITVTDIKNLTRANALTQAELRRLYVSGRITTEMYKQGMALSKQQGQVGQLTMMERMRNSLGGWVTGGGAKWGALGGLALGGLKSLGSSILGFFGGLPGIAISAGLAIFSYYKQKSAELKQDMEQTLNELKDRSTQMGEFLRDNDADKAIAGGDMKEIDNMIDSYKEKLRQISPESAQAFKMKADEIASHKERLRYLQQQLELLQKANSIAQKKSQDEDTYEKLRDDTKDAVDATNEILKASAALRKVHLTGTEKGEYDDAKKDFDKYIEYLGEKYKKEFKKLKDSPEQQEAFRALRDNLLAAQGASEEGAIQIRSALNRYLGLEDTEMETAFAKKLMEMVDTTFPDIADRIRAHKELDEESKKKVDNLMRGAVSQLSIDYPLWEESLQDLLKNSNFEARIKLVYDTGAVEDLDPFQQRIYNNILGTNITKWRENALKFDELKPFLKGVTDMYTARNNVKTELEQRYNKWKAEEDAKKKGKGDEKERLARKKSYEDLWNAAYMGLGYSYTPEDKKSNKTPKTKTHEEDEELKRLRQQMDDYKAARQMYQKLVKETGMGKAKARNEVVGLFPNLDWKKLDLSNYLGSIDRLMPGKGFWTTPERKSFQTQMNREKADWKISEELKPEWERVSQNFKEALEKGVKQADLEKELLEKTGNADYAKLAWEDGAVWDGHTRKMAEDFKTQFGQDVDLGMTDADAKKHFEELPLAYEEWQKITGLVKDNYVKFLQQGADIMVETASTAEKLAAVDAKYEGNIKKAEAQGDTGLAVRYTRQREKEKNTVRSDAFKKSSDYLTFYGAISELGTDKASAIATQIRENINQSLQDGTIDAREYAKEIQQLDEQLNKLSGGKKTFWNSGLQGVAEQRLENANDKMTAGAALKQEGEQLLMEGLQEMDPAKIAEGAAKKKEGEEKAKQGEAEAKAALKFKAAMAKVSEAADKINANIQSVVGTFNDIKETATALGIDTESDGWQDATAFFTALGGVSDSLSNIVKSGMTGNVGGVLQGVVGVFTSPIKALAAVHDAKLDRQIKLAERNITELERMSSNIQSVIEKALGGLYSYQMDAATKDTLKKVTDSYENGSKGWRGKIAAVVGKNSSSQYGEDTYEAAKASLSDPTNAYQAEKASLLAQRDEIERQKAAEEDKKNKDKDKIADYEQQLTEMSLKIKTMTQDFLKDMYSIDMKSWASQLTDAVVSAWEKGEDAMDAYKKKAKELVKDVTKNIVSQKFMEKALEKPLEYLEKTVDEKGKLDEGDMGKLVDGLMAAGDQAVYNITAVMDALKKQGYDFTEAGTGSVSSSIKSVTEETADLLASYLNAIRLDVSVNRAQVKAIGELLQEQVPEMGQIQKAQLGQLTQLVVLAEQRNSKIDWMMNWMTAVSTAGRKKVYVS